jgi:hypothetical protein
LVASWLVAVATLRSSSAAAVAPSIRPRVAAARGPGAAAAAMLKVAMCVATIIMMGQCVVSIDPALSLENCSVMSALCTDTSCWRQRRRSVPARSGESSHLNGLQERLQHRRVSYR